jgi:hypothetical protein
MFLQPGAQARRPRASDPKKFDAPVAGWISNRALASPSGNGIPAPQGAIVLDNYFPRAGTVKLRRGKQLYATLENTDIPVTALFSYRNGNNERLFGANEETIYDLTSIVTPFSGEIVADDDNLIVTEGGDWFGFSSTEGLDVISNFTGGDWVVVQFATTGGVYLIGVNGEDDGFIFDGDFFWANISGGVSRLNYDAETVAFVDGESITGGTSGATATIYRVTDEGAGVGYLLIYDITGTFVDNETLTGSIAGSATSNGVASVISPGVTFGSSGLTTADMSYVWVYKNRLYFAQKDSLVAWYLDDADAIGGDATPFPLSGVFGLGGSLMFGQAWSLEGGAQGGLSEQCVFVSNQGEVAIYQGLFPGDADTWAKVGTYRIGRPLGKRAFLRGGGDLAIATSVGLVPLSKAISLDITSLNIATVSYAIADAWADATQLRGFDDWQCALWPEQKMAIVSPPDLIGSSEPVLFVSNSETGAWARFTGWQALCMEVFRGQLYFGSPDGKVFQANVSGVDEDLPYTGTVVPMHDDFGNPTSLKVPKVARTVSRSNTAINAQVTTSFDFDDARPSPPDAAASDLGNVWGEGIWGQSVWGTKLPSVINQGWQSVGGAGYAVAPCYQVTSGSLRPLDDELIRIDLTYTVAEMVS